MNNKLNFLDLITLVAFGVGVYSLYIALENLQENREQNDDLKQILIYLEGHLQDQDNHLASQDRILENITERRKNEGIY